MMRPYKKAKKYSQVEEVAKLIERPNYNHKDFNQFINTHIPEYFYNPKSGTLSLTKQKNKKGG